MSEQISFGGAPVVGFGDATVASPTRQHLDTGAASAVQAAVVGGIGTGIGYAVSKPKNKAKHQRNGAIIGAAASGALTGAMFSAPWFCGLFSSKDEQKKIDREQLPREILGAVVGGAATLAGGALGSMVSKSHPIVGALAGSAVSAGVAAAVLNATAPECPPTTGGGWSIG